MFNILEQNPAVLKMRSELTNAGVKELKTPQEVDDAIKNQKESMVIFINSVCGCAAGSARPGFVASLKNGVRPIEAFTVFAGQDKEATEQARKYFTNQPPSSPAIAFFKKGEFLGMIHREQIEGTEQNEVIDGLTQLYNEHYA